MIRVLNFYYMKKEGNSGRNYFLLHSGLFYKLSMVDFIISEDYKNTEEM